MAFEDFPQLVINCIYIDHTPDNTPQAAAVTALSLMLSLVSIGASCYVVYRTFESGVEPSLPSGKLVGEGVYAMRGTFSSSSTVGMWGQSVKSRN